MVVGICAAENGEEAGEAGLLAGGGMRGVQDVDTVQGGMATEVHQETGGELATIITPLQREASHCQG